MVRNFTFLLYLVCLLIAIAYPSNLHQPAAVTIYAVEATTAAPEAIPINKQTRYNRKVKFLTIRVLLFDYHQPFIGLG